MEGDGFIDMENSFNNKEEYGYKDITMRQFNKVVNNMSQEMRKGITIFVQRGTKDAQVSRYFPDTRKELVQSIDCLHDILQPRFDETMIEKSKELLVKITEIKEESESESEFWRKKLVCYRELFRELCFYLERKKWFESQTFED